MKRRFVFCLGAMLFAGTLAAQTPVPEWQAGVDKVKSLIKTNPEQASDAAGELLKGKNKKNVELVTSVARAYLDVGQLKEAETYLEMARKADNKAPAVSVLEGDIAFARKDIGKACQLYEQAIYFDSNYKDAYLKYAQAYKSASPSQAIEKLNQLKAIAPDCLEADKELAEVYYATNRFGNRLVMYNNVDLKRYDEAEKAADAFFNASDNADYSCLDYRYHGALLSALKKYDQAIEEYGKALEKDESQVDLWREIADAYELKNDYTQAIAAYKKYYDSLAQDKKTSENLFQLGRLYYGEGTSSDTLSVQSADRMAALQAADSVFALVAEQAPDSYLGDMWRARTHSAMDPETTEGLAKPYYEKVVDVLLAKNEPRYNSALIECYSYLGYYYLLKSDYATSKEYWNKILAIDPTNATANKALDGIK